MLVVLFRNRCTSTIQDSSSFINFAWLYESKFCKGFDIENSQTQKCDKVLLAFSSIDAYVGTLGFRM